MKVTFSSVMDKHQTKRPKPTVFETKQVTMAGHSIMAEQNDWLIHVASTDGATYRVGKTVYDHMEITQ